MITTQDIERHVEASPSTTREMFYSLIESDDKYVKRTVAAIGTSIISFLKLQSVEVSPTPNWFEAIAQTYDLQELWMILEAANDKAKNSLKVKLLQPFRGLIITGYGYLLNLKLKGTTKEQHEQVGDALCLAYMWRTLKNDL